MDDVHPKMCFTPSPPPSTPKTIFSSNLTFVSKCSSDQFSLRNTNYHFQDYNCNNISTTKKENNMQRSEEVKLVAEPKVDEETTSDYIQWLHAMKLVARLPGGIPPEFRRKLWLSLADKYLKSQNVDWAKEEEKCFCLSSREDDEELGIQIVKDLHRTGSTLCTGPAGDLNQAKLKRILLGYARYNPEVGYCQGFNMLGALILQIMDKDESESIKVMIYLVEGILPAGYFCGSMGGLQADMAVFRELMQTKLPRLAKHLQKLQGPVENAYEPPLTNVFTMQWFLTMFCTCLPMSCVLRVWDLVLIEGSDVLLRTALALWSLLEERVLSARSADDFYGRMGSFSSELLNGHLIDSNGLIEKVVQMGPIADIQKLRDKHLYNIAPIDRQQGLQLFYDEDEQDIDENSRLAVATVWGIPWGRRGSQGQPNSNVAKQAMENKDRIALDISLLKKQYDRLRERQKQAQIILTSACSTASRHSAVTAPLPVNQLLSGCPAIVTNKGRRSGPPTGAVPPARKPSLPAVLHDKPLKNQLKRGETLHWRDTKDAGNRRDSLSWKEIKAERAAMITSGSVDGLKSKKIRSNRLGKSDSSSYSDESDDKEVKGVDGGSSTDTSLCDDDLQSMKNNKTPLLYTENNPKSSQNKSQYKSKKSSFKHNKHSKNLKDIGEKPRPKSWAPSNTEIPFVLMTTDSPSNSADENPEPIKPETTEVDTVNDQSNISTEKIQTNLKQSENLKWKFKSFPLISDDSITPKTEAMSFNKFESTSKEENIPFLDANASLNVSGDKDGDIKAFDISSEGVTNQYFERVNSTERPTRLDLLYSLNEDENVREGFRTDDEYKKSNNESLPHATYTNLDNSNNIRCIDLLVDYSEKSSAAYIEEAKTEMPTTFESNNSSAPKLQKTEYSASTNGNLLKARKSVAEKRRDPRRLTLTRSSTMDIEKRYQALEKRLSMEVYSNNKRSSDEIEIDIDDGKVSQAFSYIKANKINGAINDFSNHINSHTTLSVDNNNLLERKIPSTADLEERFQNIQKQLQRDRNKTLKSPYDSENDSGNSNLDSSAGNSIRRSSENNKKLNKGKKCDNNEDNEEIEREEILGAHSDLEQNSFESNEFKNNNKESSTKDAQAVTVQASKSTISERTAPDSKKEPPDEDRQKSEEKELTLSAEIETNTDKNVKVSEKSLDDSNKSAQKSNSKIITEEKYIEEEYKCPKRTSERTSPPTTEELEKRFNALEDQMCSAKSEPYQAHCRDEKKSEKSPKTTADQKVKGDAFCKKNVEKTLTDTTETEANNSDIVLATHEANISKFEPDIEKSNKRRLSEPPSTEDLEKRYEVLKRRMSSRNFETKPIDEDENEMKKTNEIKLNKSARHLKTEDSSVPTSNKHSPPSIENLEERYEKLQNKNVLTKATSTKSHLSAEKLKDRFEKHQQESELNSETSTQTLSSKQIPKEELGELASKREHHEATKSDKVDICPEEKEISDKSSRNLNPDKSNKKETRKSLDNGSTAVITKISHDEIQTSDQNETVPTDNEEVFDAAQRSKDFNILPKNDNKIKVKLIEELQAKIKEHSMNHDVDSSVEKKMALIQELKSKIDRLPETFLKPTQISSRRKPSSHITLLPSLSLNDETLESHATSAYRRSEKYEPSYSAKRKTVRRFSDLPSRADLENRLQFLEEQLSKTVCMQRRSSDSEVASKARLKNKAAHINVTTAGSLEHRSPELEKRLKEKNTSLDVELSKDTKKLESDIEISQIDVVADTAALTGKELVRYSSNGTGGNVEHQNPINISISIQMTLNKDDIGKSADLSKTDDLDRRIQLLEQQLKASQVYDGHENIADNAEDSVREKNENKSFNAQLSTDENKTDDDEIEKKQDIDDLNGALQNNEKEIKQLDCDDLCTATGSLSSLDPKNSETSKTSTQDRKLIEPDLLSDECSGKVDSSCQLVQINPKDEKTKSVESKISDMNSSKELTSPKELSSSELIEEDKEIKNNSVQCQGKENNITEVTEPELNSKIENNPVKSEQRNLIEDKNNTNSVLQETQTLDNGISNAQQLVQENESSTTQPNESTEPKISELDKKDISEAEKSSEIKKLLNSNDGSQMVPVEVNKKTLVLLLDNEPKAVKVRRLTRANTEELEDLFQALEKQLNDRGQQKICEERKKAASNELRENDAKTSKEISALTKEIESFSHSDSKKAEKNDKSTEIKQKKQEEEFDWGIDPIKYHLKKRTVYLPSTKELEARFRSLERQIKLLEDVEKIDVEQRLIEIERKIKLQYSLSHEKDLNKFLELCEGKDPDEMPTPSEIHQGRKEYCNEVQSEQKSKHASPSRLKSTPPSSNSLDHHYRSLDLKRSNSKQSFKKQPIHPLEMLLDPSPDDSDIPTTGELEHRIRVLEENRYTPSPSSQKSRSQSPPTKRNKTKPNTHNIARITSPSERELPTAEELEARLEALEKEQSFDFKMQKNFQQFNQKLKNVVSPSLSSDDFKPSAQVCDSGQTKLQSCSTPKQTKAANAISPKTIRFCEDEHSTQKETNATNTIKASKETQQTTTVNEGLGVMGIRLMRETSPLRRKGTHTGIPLRTGENINDQLTSIQNTIKSIDSLCEEKPYRRERCQQYIDALFSDSTHFAHKKISLEDLTAHNLSRSTSREIGPSIRISDQGSLFSRSLGSADSIPSSSPLRSTSPLQYRSNRDLRRELSPRRRHDEDREELESRVRRDNLLPNNIYNSHSMINHTSHSSLIKFHKVDSQLNQNDVKNEENLRPPAFSTIGNLIYHENANTSNEINATPLRVLSTEVTAPNQVKSQYSAEPPLPLYQTLPSSSNPPVYHPAKLEIRHTTVTSTFYDRVLAEKQLEKQHNSGSTNNQSPMVSPLLEGNVKPIYQ